MLFFSKTKNLNAFTSMLLFLGIKHTSAMSNKYFNEHPHKYNLFGLSKMLSAYGVDNAATKIADKENDIFNIQTPFIAHMEGDFAAVSRVTPEKVNFIWRGKRMDASIENFNRMWTGIILLVEPTEKAIEPDYKEHRYKELFNIAQNIFLTVLICILLLFIYVSEYSRMTLGLNAALILDIIGVYIGFLLVQKQMHIHSEYADKICSLFKQNDCNNVLESKAAKFLGIIGWSEIGLGYFISNICIILFFPALLPYLVVINILTLPYSFWSIWYQKFKVKQWCPLCLIVQLLLWGTFAINLIFGFISMPNVSTTNILLVLSVYLIPSLIINSLVPMLSLGKKVEQMTQEINSIKSTDEVFIALLKKQPFYNVTKETSQIFFGNLYSETLVTILTNPHCNPCAKLHKQIEPLLRGSNENLCIQLIFSSFEEDLDRSNKLLIDVYFQNQKETVLDIYQEWFEKEDNRDQLLNQYRSSINNEMIENEFAKHSAWIEQTGLSRTPTILVNGYKLPDNYKIEDIQNFNTSLL